MKILVLTIISVLSFPTFAGFKVKCSYQQSTNAETSTYELNNSLLSGRTSCSHTNAPESKYCRILNVSRPTVITVPRYINGQISEGNYFSVCVTIEYKDED